MNVATTRLVWGAIYVKTDGERLITPSRSRPDHHEEAVLLRVRAGRHQVSCPWSDGLTSRSADQLLEEVREHPVRGETQLLSHIFAVAEEMAKAGQGVALLAVGTH